jgi:deoxyhypusine synthase
VDSTIALPILTAYALGKRKERPLKRLYTKRDALMEEIRIAHLESSGAKGHRS